MSTIANGWASGRAGPALLAAALCIALPVAPADAGRKRCVKDDGCAAAAVRARPCPAAGSDAVAETLRAFFEALASDDEAAARRQTAPGFYAFDIGKRFTLPELSKLIADAHRSGRVIQWKIGAVDARIDCNMAFAAWENVGAAGTASKMEPRTWLESAVLVRQGDRWAIQFLHSTPKDPRP